MSCDRKIGPFDCCSVVQGDCLELMKLLPDGCVDAAITDPPYGTTACRWDAVIPLAPWFSAMWRVCREPAPIISFCAQPFTSALIAAQFENFRYTWVWEKQKPTNFLKARLMPLRSHEDIAVFCRKGAPYFPQGTRGVCIKSGRENKAARGVYLKSESQKEDYVQTEGNFPRSILKFDTDTDSDHPTGKPVDVLAYLIKTYTKEGALILDPTIGSGSTAIAAQRTARHFLGFELESPYVAIARKRIAAVEAQPTLFEPKPVQEELGL